MVRRGEYLERAVVIPRGDGQPLEGLYHRGKKPLGLLIAPPAPVGGGSMESALIAELAWAVTRAGHPTLRFNYAGVGASPGDFGGGEGALDDLAAAADHLRACVGGVEGAPGRPIAICGIGLGARLALRFAATDGRVQRLVCVSPSPAQNVPPTVSQFPGELLVIAAGLDPEKDAMLAWADQAAHGHSIVIAEADAAFGRGLVEAGRAVAEMLSSSGRASR